MASASYPYPQPGTAVVDGNYEGEWDLSNDFFAEMYLSGQIEDKIVLTNLYLRYDLNTHTLYVLVLTVDNSITMIIDKNQVETYFKIDNEIKVSPPESENFKWVNPDTQGKYAMGFEASFMLDPGTYNILVHANVAPEGKSQTSSTLKAGINLVVLPESDFIFMIASIAAAIGLFTVYKRFKKTNT